MHKPRGLGWFGALTVLSCLIHIRFIIANDISDIGILQLLLFLSVPCALCFPCYLLSEKIFLKITRSNAEKSRKYADYTDNIIFIITIVMITIFYNIGILEI